MHIMEEITKRQLKKGIPSFRSGDTVCVTSKVKEGEKERLQAFEGVVISRKGASVSETFTVRKVSYGVGVERIFLLNSPMIDKIEVKQQGEVRRAKLYYLRELTGKAARIADKKAAIVKDETVEAADEAVKEETK